MKCNGVISSFWDIFWPYNVNPVLIYRAEKYGLYRVLYICMYEKDVNKLKSGLVRVVVETEDNGGRVKL